MKKTMKRFWLFGYERCYPHGGMKDFRGDFDTLDECKEAIKGTTLFANVLDTSTMKVVWDERPPDVFDVWGFDDPSLNTDAPPDKRLQGIYPKEVCRND